MMASIFLRTVLPFLCLFILSPIAVCVTLLGRMLRSLSRTQQTVSNFVVATQQAISGQTGARKSRSFWMPSNGTSAVRVVRTRRSVIMAATIPRSRSRARVRPAKSRIQRFQRWCTEREGRIRHAAWIAQNLYRW